MANAHSSGGGRRKAARPTPFNDRDTDGRARLWLEVLQLMRSLESQDPNVAAEALADLNGIASWFDWQTLLPKEMPASQRARAMQLLRLMAGTNSVGEACNAYRTALRMLRQCDRAWQWEAA